MLNIFLEVGEVDAELGEGGSYVEDVSVGPAAQGRVVLAGTTDLDDVVVQDVHLKFWNNQMSLFNQTIAFVSAKEIYQINNIK